jgi:hypothetical protein
MLVVAASLVLEVGLLDEALDQEQPGVMSIQIDELVEFGNAALEILLVQIRYEVPYLPRNTRVKQVRSHRGHAPARTVAKQTTPSCHELAAPANRLCAASQNSAKAKSSSGAFHNSNNAAARMQLGSQRGCAWWVCVGGNAPL